MAVYESSPTELYNAARKHAESLATQLQFVQNDRDRLKSDVANLQVVLFFFEWIK